MDINLQVGDTFINTQGHINEIVEKGGSNFKVYIKASRSHAVYSNVDIVYRIKKEIYHTYTPVLYGNIQVGDVYVNTVGNVSRISEINNNNYTIEYSSGTNKIVKEHLITRLKSNKYTDYHSVDSLNTIDLRVGDTYLNYVKERVKINEIRSNNQCDVIVNNQIITYAKHEIQLHILTGKYTYYKPATFQELREFPKKGAYHGYNAAMVYLTYFKPLGYSSKEAEHLLDNLYITNGFRWEGKTIISGKYHDVETVLVTKQQIINNFKTKSNHEQITKIKSDSRREIKGKQITSNKTREVAVASRLVGNTISYRKPRTVTREFKIFGKVISG